MSRRIHLRRCMDLALRCRTSAVLWVAGLCHACAGFDDEPAAPSAAASTTAARAARTTTIPLGHPTQAGGALRHELMAAGRRGMPALARGGDAVVAMHALWEQEKQRPGDPSALRAAFRARLGLEPPSWWCALLARVEEHARCHYFPGVDSSHLQESSRLRMGSNELVARPGIAGFEYDLELHDLRRDCVVWKTRVWAAGRTALIGVGVHQIELVAKGESVFVFGAESHGAYAEEFRLADGEPLFRFCTSYWQDFSESWGLR